jgi:fructose-1,6-bisphosphatase/sedoheptulose 1,7-bisphosphatase-like protein
VGTGWDPQLEDPKAWYPGYSGALSLMLCANAASHGGHRGIRPLTDYLYLNKLLVPRELPRIDVQTSPEEMVRALSDALDVPPEKLCAAALARNRHLTTMARWLEAGMKPWNLLTPSDGDSTFALAMGAGALQMAGLSGGVVEGIIAGAAGVPVGLQTSYQFVSHERLGEHTESAELCREDHRFGFSEQEYQQMVQNRLFDGEHLGHTLRLLPEYFEIVADIFNWASREREVEDFDFESFQKEFEDIVRHPDKGTRFSAPARRLIHKVLAQRDWLDVRGVYGYQDFVRTRDWLFAATALTPNRFAPLKGLQRGTDGRYITETVVVGGSSAVGILVAEAVQVK